MYECIVVMFIIRNVNRFRYYCFYTLVNPSQQVRFANWFHSVLVTFYITCVLTISGIHRSLIIKVLQLNNSRLWCICTFSKIFLFGFSTVICDIISYTPFPHTNIRRFVCFIGATTALWVLLTRSFLPRNKMSSLPFTTNEMISISTSHIFRSWVVIFHLRRLMEFLSLS